MIYKQLRIDLKSETQERGNHGIKRGIVRKENSTKSKMKYPSHLNANTDIILKRDGSQLHSTNLIENGFRKGT